MSYKNIQLYINGEFLPRENRDTKQIVNPVDNEHIGEFDCATAADLDYALDSAQQAFLQWKKTSPLYRSELLRKFAQVARERAAEIGRNITLDQGKPLKEAVGEVTVCAEHAEWHAEECRRIYGRTIAARQPNVEQTVIREPVGVCLAISPWNFPFNQAIRKISAAIAAGCTVIVKGSSDTPSAVNAIAEIFHEIGLPKGVLNIIWGDSNFISDYLIQSPILQKVSFTGSTPVGKKIAALASMNMKACTMELGGHAPVIICKDANIDRSVEQLVSYKFRNAGQVCVSPTRFYVEEAIYQEFSDKVVKCTQQIKVGNGLDKVDMGPLAQTRRVGAMEQIVEDALSKNARLLQGGRRIAGKGNFFEPTVLADLNNDTQFMNDEPFGPMIGLIPFSNLDDVLEEANRLPFGLASYAFTSSLKNAHQISHGLEAGMVSINHMGLAIAETPFGGIKESGFGSEGGLETFDGYLRTKFITKLCE
ncbi:NAD-dependent succinate-semialdehyde dehydrogenase [Acinetobacter terrae]|uniref:NAD-dependent succinate-semialdehyde dehydrogenase n=1 Tax=Acinetobacter terrae TaxID=2731247 RepID=UPI0007D77AD7|nr:NAD-dependent succinate-semialdehyde dehydrogenase [Acinetobacter terrae]OAL86407.1 NAD-dependent succinate-semialdehyde dehydrogenase [Acinetobacter terrae]